MRLYEVPQRQRKRCIGFPYGEAVERSETEEVDAEPD